MAKGTRKLTKVISSEFNRLMVKHDGLLMPELVVEEAKKVTSPLHKYFTWNDDDAAHKWRVQEARMLIKSYAVYNEELNVSVTALTSLEIDRDNGGGYRWTMDVVKRPDMRQQMVETALNELSKLRAKYRHLKELSELWDVIDERQAQRVAAEEQQAKDNAEIEKAKTPNGLHVAS